MRAYAQYNPNKGQGDLIKSNSPTSAHQLAPAPLRHAKDLTVMRQATQLIPWPPPLNHGGCGRGGVCYCSATTPSTTPHWTGQTAQPCHDPKDNGCSPRRCANTSPRHIFLWWCHAHTSLSTKNDMSLLIAVLKHRCFKCHIHEERKRTGAQTVGAVWLYWLKALMYSFIHFRVTGTYSSHLYHELNRMKASTKIENMPMLMKHVFYFIAIPGSLASETTWISK